MLATVDKAAACGNPQILGRSGELPLLDFFNRYLPLNIRAVTGFFLSPRGQLSPQVDILIIDSRYPLLAHNSDGTVIAPLHSVLQAIEVKVSASKREIANILHNAELISNISSQVFGRQTFTAVRTQAIAYKAKTRMSSLSEHFFVGSHRETDITVLRVLPRDNAAFPRALGAEWHWEPSGTSRRKAGAWIETVRPTLAPLSDIYYQLVQNAYYTLSARDFTMHDLGVQMNDYLAWGTFLPNAIPGGCCADQLRWKRARRARLQKV